MTEMQVKNAEELVRSLKSGDYKQATGCLMRANGEESFCCLGVGCMLMEWDTQKVSDDKLDDEGLGRGFLPGQRPRAFTDPNGQQLITMPNRTLFEEYFGIDSEDQSSLADRNDNDESFDRIAERITELIGSNDDWNIDDDEGW